MKNNSLFVIFSLKPGGTQRMMVNVLNEIKTDGRKKVLFLYNYSEGFSLESQLNDDIIIYRSSYRGYFKYLIRLIVLVKIIYKENIDKIISFSTNGSYLSIIARFFLLRRKIKIVYRLVSVDEALVNSNKLMVTKIKRLFFTNVICRYNDIIIGQSKYMSGNLIQKQLNILKNKVITINNLLPIKKIKELSEEPVELNYPYILFVGRLSKEKNILGLILAYQRIESMIAEKLVIIGGGVLDYKLKYFVKENNLTNRIVFLGIKENPYKYMNKAKAFVLFSEYEGMPNVILEAMVCKTAVVVSNFDGVDDIVKNNLTGVIVPKQDVVSLSKELKSLLMNDGKIKELSNRAYDNIISMNEVSISKYTNILS